MAINISSSAFQNEGMIPKKYTCDGPDVSPPLKWTGVPSGTKSICVIMDDPDAPVGTWVHWVLYNLQPETSALTENVAKTEKLPNGTLQGINDFKRVGYGGPCPPGGPAHRYFFKIYALDTNVNLPPRATKKQLEDAIKDHIVDKGVLMGKYGR